MKILQVNCVFQKGSTGKIVNDIHVFLQKNGYESVVCYGRGTFVKASDVYKFCTETEAKIQALWSRLGGLPYGGSKLSARRLIRIIEKEKPDVVHLHCINGYCVNIYDLLKYLGRKEIKTIVTHHAEFYYTGSCGHALDCKKYLNVPGCQGCPDIRWATKSFIFDCTAQAWQRMREAFGYFKKENLIFTAVSPWVKSRSVQSPLISNFECEVIGNGVELSVFKPASLQEMDNLRKRIPFVKQHIAIHVTASFSTDERSIKGGKHIVELARRMPDVAFIVVAIHIGELKDIPSNVHLWGRAASQQELAALYSLADVCVIASKRETFSMICAESLCCGTSVAGFLAGGPETIAVLEYSRFVEYGNLDALENAVKGILNSSSSKEEISHQAHLVYSKENMGADFVRLYHKILYK